MSQNPRQLLLFTPDPSYKEQIVVEREFENQKLVGEALAEIEYQPSKCAKKYRVVILRKNITVKQGEKALFDKIRYFFYITNRTDKVEKIVGLANGRCNQENVIEQLKNGVNAMRMPMADPVSNWAYVITSTLFLQEAQVLFDFLEVDFDRPT